MNFTASCLALSPHAEITPQVFGIPLSQVISNDRTHKQRHDPPKEGHSDPTELMLSFLHLTSSFKRANKELSSSNSSLSSTSETPNESPPLRTPYVAPRTRRRVGIYVIIHRFLWEFVISCVLDVHAVGGCCSRDLSLSTHCTVFTHVPDRAEYLWIASLTLMIISRGSWRPSNCLCQ